jgi:hypothetical protein
MQRQADREFTSSLSPPIAAFVRPDTLARMLTAANLIAEETIINPSKRAA